MKKTKNGIGYRMEHSNLNRVSCILFAKEKHSMREVRKAIKQIRSKYPAMRPCLANAVDHDRNYRRKILNHPKVAGLPWYLINVPSTLIYRERLKGTSVKKYVKRFVLPDVERRKRKFSRLKPF